VQEDPGKLFLPPNQEPDTTAINQSPTPPTSFNANPDVVLKPKKRGLKALMIAIIAVVVFGAAGAFAYFGVYVPNQPENVLKTALANFMASDSGEVKGELALSFGDYTVHPSFGYSGAADGSASFNLGLNAFGLVLSAEVKQIADDVYVKLDGIDALSGSWEEGALVYGADPGFVNGLSAMLGELSGQWLVVNDVVKPEEKPEQVPDLTQEDFTRAFADKDIIASAEKLGKETVENRPAERYRVTLDKDQLKAGIDALRAGGLTDELRTDGKNVIDKVDLSDIEVWVYTDHKEIAKVIYVGSLGQLSEAGTFELSIVFVSYNQTSTIEPPADPTDAKALWQELERSLEGEELFDSSQLDFGPSFLDSIQSL